MQPLGILMLECTNFPAFAAAIAKATGRLVFDILTLGQWLHAGLVPQPFAETGDSR